MSAPKFTVKELKERMEDGEMDLSLSSLGEQNLPLKEMKQLKKMHGLDLSCNVMTALPAELCTFTQLTKLDVSKNLLTHLPDNIGELTNLQSLDLLGNKLKTLPESFGDLKSLRWLDVRDNPLSSAILKEAGDCLDDKQCKTCALRVVKLMNYVHVEREKIRVDQRAKEEAEARRLEEEAKKEKKRLKLEEKERKRQEFLLKRQQNMQSAKASAGDTSEEEVEESGANSSSSTDDKEGGNVLCSVLATLFMLFIFQTTILAAIFGVYYYCESSPESMPAVCMSTAWNHIKYFIEDTALPIAHSVQEQVTTWVGLITGEDKVTISSEA